MGRGQSSEKKYASSANGRARGQQGANAAAAILYGDTEAREPRPVDLGLNTDQRQLFEKQQELNVTLEQLNEIVRAVVKTEIDTIDRQMKQTTSGGARNERAKRIIANGGAEDPTSQYDYLINQLGVEAALEELLVYSVDHDLK